MKKFNNSEVESLLADALKYVKSKEDRKKVIESVHIAESRTGARITTVTGVKDDFFSDPENQSMLQALNSREAGGFVKNLSEVLKRGSRKFMEKFFVGYGHKSIGDCGTVLLFIDGISMIATKQFQNWPLYSGQETSTRYVDVSGVGYLNPYVGIDRIKEQEFESLFSELFGFYKKALPEMKEVIAKRFPKQAGQKESQYENAVTAKACDILGAFLPCGARTNMSIIMNIRQMGEHLTQMSFDQLDEVRMLSQDCMQFLTEIYPSSFPPKLYNGHAEYWKLLREQAAYFLDLYGDYPEYEFSTSVMPRDLYPWTELINCRPKGCELPKEMRKLGNCRIDHIQDFRSMRDGYRHRDGYNRVPLVNTSRGFESWYLIQLTRSLFDDTEQLLLEIEKFFSKNEFKSKEGLLMSQYIVPMGYKQPCQKTLTFPSMVYYAELRSGSRVHPTERRLALKVADSLQQHFPQLKMHIDCSESEWNIKRGQDTIA